MGKKSSSTHRTSKSSITYRFARIPFGLICSPFLLQSIIHHHLESYDDPLAQLIKRNTYVDNVIIAINEDQDANSRYEKAKMIFAEAKMNLREFATNNELLRQTIKPEDLYPEEKTKILGLQWSTKKDTLMINFDD